MKKPVFCENDMIEKKPSGNIQIDVSVIIPLYNEEKYIEVCMDSLINQTFPIRKTEWIFVDGQSTDNTVKLIERCKTRDKYPIIILVNKKRKTPYGLNIAIKQARGKYIIRLDAHAKYADDYIEKCVYYLDTTDADNVGGYAVADAENKTGKLIAKILSSRFGVGNSNFRTDGKSGYVDTVPFGAFRREVFDKIGLFNTKLIRSEDNDINARIRANGGKVFLASDIKFTYYCRNTVAGLLKMGLQNGNALFPTVIRNHRAMSIRHFIPFAFLLSLLIMPILAAFFKPIGWLLAAEFIVYLSLDAYFSFSDNTVKDGFYSLLLYPLFHICYGVGSLLGVFGIKLY